MATLTPGNYENWIPEEYDSDVLRAVNENSVIESIARRYPMSSDTKQIPRSGGTSVSVVPKGGTYGQSTHEADAVVLVAVKFGDVQSVNYEDLQDPYVNVIQQIQLDWARSYALMLDNAALAVTGDANGSTRPFNSVYFSVRNSNSKTNYVADSNYVASASGGVTYDDLNAVLGRVEQGDYFSEANIRVLAHPAFRQTLRGIKDNEGRPIFEETSVTGLAGTEARATLFGHPIMWALGARTSAEATDAPEGNPLLIIANTNFLALGVRSGPESATSGVDEGIGFMTDTAALKVRSRRAFAVTQENAVAVLEDTSA